MDRMIKLLDEACEIVEAVHKYQAILNETPDTVSEEEFKTVLKRVFTHAKRFSDMRLKNLMDAAHGNDDE